MYRSEEYCAINKSSTQSLEEKKIEFIMNNFILKKIFANIRASSSGHT